MRYTGLDIHPRLHGQVTHGGTRAWRVGAVLVEYDILLTLMEVRRCGGEKGHASR